MKQYISIIIPVYNEERNISILYHELLDVLGSLQCDYEIIFVNDGSSDGSSVVIEALAEAEPRVKYLEFSRNFGKEIATTAGIIHAKGEAAILIDADLQHPPGLIPQFIAKWQQGADMVIGVRKRNPKEGIIKRIGGTMFYQLVNIMGETKITPHATDYRLIDRKVILAFHYFTEKNRLTRGLLDWLGFRRDYLYFDADPRRNGGATYSYRKLSRLAIYTFVSHSLFPLKVAGYLGLGITLFSGLFGTFIFIEKYILHDPWGLSFSGPAILAVINLFLVGIVLSSIGVISLYIGNIHEEVLARPLYVIRSQKNLDEKD
jgi:glycosyltransferase involved in cell wall biosynthesis